MELADQETAPEATTRRLWWAVAVCCGAVAVGSLVFIEQPLLARAALVAGVCLTLWLSEAVPPYVPTFVLWALTPLLLQPLSADFRLGRVMAWAAEPVLALFLGGFTLSVAARRYGLDARVAQAAVRFSQGNGLALLALTTLLTAGLSMWLSNVAAVAMMIAALRPLWAKMPADSPLRRALLVGVAMGGNLGGIATPVGTGPNAIAIAAVSRSQPLSFLSWMAFAVPLTVGLLLATIVMLRVRFNVSDAVDGHELQSVEMNGGAWAVLLIFVLTIIAWLTEPWHGAPSAVVALLAAAVLFGSGLLAREDLNAIDWSTLALIAGGISLGNLLEQSGLVKAAAAFMPWGEVSPFTRIFALCFISALLAALMSNTATVTMLIPLAASFDPAPSTAILIAVGASLGVPFVISTPPNAMVYGEGGVKSSDFLWPGLALMFGGCLLISATGPLVLRWLGIP